MPGYLHWRGRGVASVLHQQVPRAQTCGGGAIAYAKAVTKEKSSMKHPESKAVEGGPSATQTEENVFFTEDNEAAETRRTEDEERRQSKGEYARKGGDMAKLQEILLGSGRMQKLGPKGKQRTLRMRKSKNKPKPPK
eukprot:CAMPEP_0172542140 /NCGR_PEP_ID=MMETSP1067-20121228/12808_1 /TAXON_ID=265564 ORGANISM="Thalassiosira punctigera, Strain Tpunct2005C2" /NCGR_SAMPLE_ID=MMETSP1067 /ASSEMBLY_ACC=CAM_ASM_000444 /LENGTH=136 /DNA_ID=CAMNT_0013328313 /DNA_START=704 /DNA_END=1115 /DNA_ORIENTATION=+